MSARIVVNLEHGFASSAIDRGPDGGTWLSLWQHAELVMVKLSTPSFQALWLALSKELGMLAGDPCALEDGGGAGADSGAGSDEGTGSAAGDASAERATPRTSAQRCATTAPPGPPPLEPAPVRAMQAEQR